MDTTIQVHGETYVIDDEGDLYLIWCMGCRKAFTREFKNPGDHPPHFHSKRCRKTHYTRSGKCPTPDKRCYATGEDAHNAFRSYVRMKGFGPEPYKCRCGSYHLGHSRWVRVKEV